MEISCCNCSHKFITDFEASISNSEKSFICPSCSCSLQIDLKGWFISHLLSHFAKLLLIPSLFLLMAIEFDWTYPQYKFIEPILMLLIMMQLFLFLKFPNRFFKPSNNIYFTKLAKNSVIK